MRPRGAERGAIPLAVAISIAGMLVHTVVEFGTRGIADVGSGFLPVSAVQLGLLLWWTRAPAQRRNAALALGATALFQLVGGAILSVLPLPILPFEPEQTARHYASHVLLGIAQAPLLVAAWRARVEA